MEIIPISLYLHDNFDSCIITGKQFYKRSLKRFVYKTHLRYQFSVCFLYAVHCPIKFSSWYHSNAGNQYNTLQDDLNIAANFAVLEK